MLKTVPPLFEHLNLAGCTYNYDPPRQLGFKTVLFLEHRALKPLCSLNPALVLPLVLALVLVLVLVVVLTFSSSYK